VDTHKIVKKDKPKSPADEEEVVAVPVKVAKPEELAPKKVAKEEKRASNAGAKSKILIEEVESETKVAAPVAVDEPKPEIKKQAKPKAEPVKLAEKVEEVVVAKVENVVQKSEEVQPSPVVEGKFKLIGIPCKLIIY
jgi:hypothetical protein